MTNFDLCTPSVTAFGGDTSLNEGGIIGSLVEGAVTK